MKNCESVDKRSFTIHAYVSDSGISKKTFFEDNLHHQHWHIKGT